VAFMKDDDIIMHAQRIMDYGILIIPPNNFWVSIMLVLPIVRSKIVLLWTRLQWYNVIPGFMKTHLFIHPWVNISSYM
jgi:hypothetical protein